MTNIHHYHWWTDNKANVVADGSARFSSICKNFFYVLIKKWLYHPFLPSNSINIPPTWPPTPISCCFFKEINTKFSWYLPNCIGVKPSTRAKETYQWPHPKKINKLFYIHQQLSTGYIQFIAIWKQEIMYFICIGLMLCS